MKIRLRTSLSALAAFVIAATSSAICGDKSMPTKSPKALIVPSKATTFVTEPLGEDGYVDYVEVLNQRFRKGVTVKNNAAVLFWRACGPARGPAAISPKDRPEFFRRLGIDPIPARGDFFVLVYEMNANLKGSARDDANRKLTRRLDQCLTHPWAAAKYPRIVEWLKRNQKPLRLLTAASRKGRFYSPLIPDTDDNRDRQVSNIHLAACDRVRPVVRALTARAMLRIEQGKAESAMQDLMTCYRLSRLIDQNPFLIPSLTAANLETIAFKATVAAVASGKLTPKQMRAWRAELRKLPGWQPMAEKIAFGERCALLASIHPIIRHGMKGVYGGEVMASRDVLGRSIENAILTLVDWNEVSKFANRWMDRVVKIAKIRDRRKRTRAFAAFRRELLKMRRELRVNPNRLGIRLKGGVLLKGPSKWIGKLVVFTMLPGTQAALDEQDARKTRLELLDLAFALAEYHSQKGRYPAKLAVLVPRHIARLPTDPFSGDGLIYRSTRTGYLLYSIGENGKDDGGRRSDELESKEDDIAVRMP